MLYVGVDIGRTVDMTAIVGVEYSAPRFVTRMIKTLHNVEFDSQVFELDLIMRRRDVIHMSIDETGIGKPIAESLRKRWGARVTPVTFTNQIKEAMILELRRLFERREIVIPMDDELIDHLHSLRRMPTASGNQIKYDCVSTRHHSDLAWALALAVWSPTKRMDVNQLSGMRVR